MAIATVRPDGWPQVTIVGYANVGLLIYFMVFRSSQKAANIRHDDRIAIAVGGEPHHLNLLQAVYSSAHACEVTDLNEGIKLGDYFASGIRTLKDRTYNSSDVVLMRAKCEHVSVLDRTQGWTHAENFTAEFEVPTA